MDSRSIKRSAERLCTTSPFTNSLILHPSHQGFILSSLRKSLNCWRSQGLWFNRSDLIVGLPYSSPMISPDIWSYEGRVRQHSAKNCKLSPIEFSGFLSKVGLELTRKTVNIDSHGLFNEIHEQIICIYYCRYSTEPLMQISRSKFSMWQ